jgi:hypothetical protein
LPDARSLIGYVELTIVHFDVDVASFKKIRIGIELKNVSYDLTINPMVPDSGSPSFQTSMFLHAGSE